MLLQQLLILSDRRGYFIGALLSLSFNFCLGRLSVKKDTKRVDICLVIIFFFIHKFWSHVSNCGDFPLQLRSHLKWFIMMFDRFRFWWIIPSEWICVSCQWQLQLQFELLVCYSACLSSWLLPRCMEETHRKMWQSFLLIISIKTISLWPIFLHVVTNLFAYVRVVNFWNSFNFFNSVLVCVEFFEVLFA